MGTKTLKYFILSGVFFVTMIVFYFFYFDDGVAQTKKDFQASSIEQNTLTVQVDASRKNTESPELSELTDEEINKLNSDSLAELKQRHYLAEKHQHERGLISPEERSVYQNYYFDTLQEMGKSGDIHALHELGQRASNEGNFKQAFTYYESAAVYGSTVAFSYLSNKYEMANQLYLDEKNGKRALIGAISYFRVAELRGDYSDSDRIEKYLSDFGAHSSGTYDEVKLDENDLQEVDRRAREIYASMEKKRIELGLGPFDNSIPEGSTAQLDKERVLAERANKN